MTELDEMRDAIMTEQRDLSDKMGMLDPLSNEYKGLQQSYLGNVKIINEIRKQENSEDNDFVDQSLRMDEIDLKKRELRWKPWSDVLVIVKELAKIGLSGACAFMMIKLIYTSEQESLMPNSKVSLAEKFLAIPRL